MEGSVNNCNAQTKHQDADANEVDAIHDVHHALAHAVIGVIDGARQHTINQANTANFQKEKSLWIAQLAIMLGCLWLTKKRELGYEVHGSNEVAPDVSSFIVTLEHGLGALSQCHVRVSSDAVVHVVSSVDVHVWVTYALELIFGEDYLVRFYLSHKVSIFIIVFASRVPLKVLSWTIFNGFFHFSQNII